MKRSPLSVIIAATLASCLQLPAQEGPREEDFLIFDKIEEDQRAVPVKPEPPPAESAPDFQRPLPGGSRGSLRTILLDVPDKSFATGRVSVLSASATQRGATAEPSVQFEDATVSLQASLDKATASLLAANPKFPDGVTLTVKAEGGYGSHEHDAAAAATAILLESIGTGRAIDTDAALLGGVDEKGRITGVQRLATRLRTLEGVAPPVIGVPMVSEIEVRDIALMNELEVLAKQQIVSLVTLDDARAITSKDRPEKVARAFALFEGVRQAASGTPLATLLKNPKFLQRLKEISDLMPNHLSARLLLQAATNKVPGRITFATSRQAILKAIKPFVNVTSTNRPAKEIQTVANEGGNVLLRMQPKIHPAAERYLVAMKAYLRSVSNFLDVPNTPQHAVMRNRAVTEMNKLLAGVQVEKEKLDKAEGSLQ